MNLKEFKKSVQRTMNQGLNNNEAMTNYSMGLAGEAGEVLDQVKKIIFHGHEHNEQDMILELGDVAYYLMALCVTLDIPMEAVLAINADKLKKRFPDGFNTADSIARADKDG